MLLKPECIHCGGYNSVGEGMKEVEREEESGEGRRKKKKKQVSARAAVFNHGYIVKSPG